MKKIFAISVIFLICAVGKTATDSNNIIVPDSNNTAAPDTNTTADCQEKIKQLEKTVESQQKIIGRLNLKLNEQTKENKRLKNLLSQAGIDISPQKDKELLKSKSENVINISLEQLCQFVKGPLTTLQQKEQYKNYGGKWIQWTGRVSHVSDLMKKGKDPEVSYFEVGFSYENAEVRVEFQESLKQKLLSLNTGSLVTYQGKLPDSYDGIAPLYHGNLSLTDGRIISIKP